MRDATSQLRELTGELSDMPPELPNGLNWNRLAEEMTGNIRVGLAAGEAIALFDKPVRSQSPAGLAPELECRAGGLGSRCDFRRRILDQSSAPAGRALDGVLAAHSHRAHRDLGAFRQGRCGHNSRALPQKR